MSRRTCRLNTEKNTLGNKEDNQRRAESYLVESSFVIFEGRFQYSYFKWIVAHSSAVGRFVLQRASIAIGEVATPCCML